MTSHKPFRLALGLTGASGIPYFVRLLERLRSRSDVELHLVSSEGGKRVLADEANLKWQDLVAEDADGAPVVHAFRNIGASLASGSFRLDAMVIIPCSMNTLSAVSLGLADNLITRAAAVQLKEGRKLILVPRETPLSLPNLRAMVAAREAGAVILPASPGFYHRPETIDGLVDTVVDRVLDQLNLADEAVRRWDP